MDYTPPKFELSAFNCPHCQAFSHQTWFVSLCGYPPGQRSLSNSAYATFYEGTVQKSLPEQFAASQCFSCKQFAIWHKENMIFPNATSAPLSNKNMPDQIKSDFEEARQVFPISPRSSAALLRLAIEKLSEHLGYSANSIDQAIGKMVTDGIEPLVQQAFDAVRVIGNESVHPGQLDIRDDPHTALQLFKLVNYIVEEKITKPQTIQAIFESLPEDKLKHIEDRNKKAKT